MLSRRTLLGVGLALAARRALASARPPASRLRRSATAAGGIRGPTGSPGWRGKSPSGPASRPLRDQIDRARGSRAVPLPVRGPFLGPGGPASGRQRGGRAAQVLSYGGFLLLDDASATRGGGFRAVGAPDRLPDRSRRAARARSPRPRALQVVLPARRPSGRVASSPDLEALELGGRLAVLYSERPRRRAVPRLVGTWEFEVTPGGSCSARSPSAWGSTSHVCPVPRLQGDQVHIPSS